MPILTRQRLLCAKVESVLGTPEVLGASEGAMNVIEMDRAPATPFTSIPAQNGLGQRKGRRGAASQTINFSLHAVGNGTTGLPYWADLLKACGGAFTSQTFSPVTNNGTGMTVGMLRGSGTTNLYRIAGAMGNAVWNFKAGEVCPIQFSFTGKTYSAGTLTMPTVTHPTVDPPIFAGGTLTIGGTQYPIDTLSFDFGNTVVMREDANDSSGSGYVSAWVANRMPKMTLAPEAQYVATKDFDDLFYSGTTQAIVAKIGTSANNTITVTAPAAQLLAPPGDGDRNGILTSELQFQLNQNGDTEDSEYTIVFS